MHLGSAPASTPNLTFTEVFAHNRDLHVQLLDQFLGRIDETIGYVISFHDASNNLGHRYWSSAAVLHHDTTAPCHAEISHRAIWRLVRDRRAPAQEHGFSPFPASVGQASNAMPSRHIVLPLEIGTEVVGVVGFLTERPLRQPDIENAHEEVARLWLSTLQAIESIQATTTARVRGYGESDPVSVLTHMLTVITRAVQFRDAYTFDHQQNVAFLCEKIAIGLGWDGDRRFGLKLGAEIHDIGKLFLPAQLLSKPGVLSAGEIMLIQEHASNGSNLFDHMTAPWPIKEMIEQHHERLDGTGYPAGLTGFKIIPEARVIAVADVFDAMASDRPYRISPGPKAAIDHIVEKRGIEFDPYAVDQLVAAYGRDPTFEGRYTAA